MSPPTLYYSVVVKTSYSTKREVVVTGLGSINPLGSNVHSSWTRLICGHSGINDTITVEGRTFPIAKIANYQPSTKYQKFPRWMQLALSASQEAIEDSMILTCSKIRIGSSIGTGFGSISHVLQAYDNFKCTEKISPYFINSILSNTPSALLAQEYGFKGPISSNSNSCATGLSAIIDGISMITSNNADVMIVGASESSFLPLIFAGFSKIRALAQVEDMQELEKISRPFDKNRHGFVMGEGAAILVLEEKSHALHRGAKVYAQIAGFGSSADGFNLAAPDPDGIGAIHCMEQGLKNALITAKEICYLNAHATSTKKGDEVEIAAIRKVFNGSLSNLFISSTKGSTGHLLGAAGSLESIFTILALKEKIAPPTLNLNHADDDHNGDGATTLNFTAKYAATISSNNKFAIKDSPNSDFAMNNSFGFGGVNISMIFKRC